MKKDEKEYISLKDASQLSGYAPDYIGQLIRSGKLHGKQVFQSVAWMTTEEDVRAYMKRKRTGSEKPRVSGISALFRGRKDLLEFSRYLKPLLYLVIAFLICVFLLLFYAFSSSLERHIDQKALQAAQRGQSL